MESSQVIVLTETLANFVVRVRGKRSRQDVSDVARREGFQISQAYIAKIESGETTSPSVEKLEALARGLRIAPQVLIDLVLVKTMAIDLQKTPKRSLDHDSSHSSDKIEAGKQGSVNDQALSSDLAPIERPDVKMIGEHEVLPISGFKRLPLFPVSCGVPVIVPDYPDEWIELPAEAAEGADAALLISGTSMFAAGLVPGDVVTVKFLNGERPLVGRKVIAEIDGGATCKQYQELNGMPVLVSAPGEGDPQLIPITEEIRIVAQVLKRIRITEDF